MKIDQWLSATGGAIVLCPEHRKPLAAILTSLSGARPYLHSISCSQGEIFALGRRQRELTLLAVTSTGRPSAFDGLIAERVSVKVEEADAVLSLIPCTHNAAQRVRGLLAWTAPRIQGLSRSAGLGDRLGMATPGHVQAVRGTGCVPYFAQQSMREMIRTGRHPEMVIDDATWGVLQAGWREGFGSDADHLKTTADIDVCDAAGFTMFTIDSGEHVRNEADRMEMPTLARAAEELPWPLLEISYADFRRRYLDQRFALPNGSTIVFDESTLLCAVVKYGRSIAHVCQMYRHLVQCKGGRPLEMEVSIDETATPTTPAEHYLVAAELGRLDVRWLGLAPRFIGDFEKGVDYIGDLASFEKAFAEHAAVARALGPYKLSIHSGSDKFSVYPIIAGWAGDFIHLKTAGTSYVEALRAVARFAPDFFRRIVTFALSRFDADRASYHISARKENVPSVATVKDELLANLLDHPDTRQLLHVTYGSVLTAKKPDGTFLFRDDIRRVLIDHEEAYFAILEQHLGRHIKPFAR